VQAKIEPRTLTPKQAAKLIGVTEHTVGRMAARGEIPGAFRAGRLWKFPAGRFYAELLGEQPPFAGNGGGAG